MDENSPYGINLTIVGPVKLIEGGKIGVTQDGELSNGE